jgi:hypothetical protein
MRAIKKANEQILQHIRDHEAREVFQIRTKAYAGGEPLYLAVKELPCVCPPGIKQYMLSDNGRLCAAYGQFLVKTALYDLHRIQESILCVEPEQECVIWFGDCPNVWAIASGIDDFCALADCLKEILSRRVFFIDAEIEKIQERIDALSRAQASCQTP